MNNLKAEHLSVLKRAMNEGLPINNEEIAEIFALAELGAWARDSGIAALKRFNPLLTRSQGDYAARQFALRILPTEYK